MLTWNSDNICLFSFRLTSLNRCLLGDVAYYFGHLLLFLLFLSIIKYDG